MRSESARATTAAEAAFRIQAPNAAPRATLVVALDRESLGVVEALAAREWRGTAFFAPSFFEAPGGIADGGVGRWFSAVAGRTSDFVKEVGASSQVIMVATSGGGAHLASVVGDACAATGTKSCALVLHDPSAGTAEALSATLRQLRPHVSMLSVVGDAGHAEAILEALRA